MAKVMPSITLLAISFMPWRYDSPKRTPRAFSSDIGVFSPLRYGRKVRPSQPGCA